MKRTWLIFDDTDWARYFSRAISDGRKYKYECRWQIQ